MEIDRSSTSTTATREVPAIPPTRERAVRQRLLAIAPTLVLAVLLLLTARAYALLLGAPAVIALLTNLNYLFSAHPHF